MNNDQMKSHLEPHPDKYDRTIADFIDHFAEMLTEGVEKNAGIQIVIYPDDVKKLYEALKAKGLL